MSVKYAKLSQNTRQIPLNFSQNFVPGIDETYPIPPRTCPKHANFSVENWPEFAGNSRQFGTIRLILSQRSDLDALVGDVGRGLGGEELGLPAR